jgi:very-short-patch-repair endonuclease
VLPSKPIRTRYPRAGVEAKRLRRDMTDVERILWARLRRKQLDGYRFRRQAPIGPYIADFACLDEMLIVEVDGGQHSEPNDHEMRRNAYLKRRKFRVLRFWNHEVLENLDGVLQAVRSHLGRTGSRG